MCRTHPLRDTGAVEVAAVWSGWRSVFADPHAKGGKLYRYYVSQTVRSTVPERALWAACPRARWITTRRSGCGQTVGRVPAGEIEAAVIDQLRTIFRQPEIVAGSCKAARAQDGDITEADARDALTRLEPLWDELFPAEQARIVALLVERIDISTDGLNVRLRMDGLAGLARKILARVCCRSPCVNDGSGNRDESIEALVCFA